MTGGLPRVAVDRFVTFQGGRHFFTSLSQSFASHQSLIRIYEQNQVRRAILRAEKYHPLGTRPVGFQLRLRNGGRVYQARLFDWARRAR